MSAPAPWKISAISSMFSSKRPSVDGFVEHQRGRVLVDPPRRSSTSMLPRASVFTASSLVARHRHRRRVRAVRGVGDDDLPALLRLAAVLEVRAHEHQARQLALRAGRRLQRDGVETRHLGEDLLQAPLELERALRAVLVLQRMEVAKPGQRHEPLVDARVVLHRAGAERIEAGVDPEVPRRELGEVADQLELGNLRQARRLAARRSSSGTSAAAGLVARERRRARRPACDFS